jgi:hypothetical protein
MLRMMVCGTIDADDIERHRRIDLGDDAARDAQDRRCEVHGHAEADEAPGIRRGNLKQRHVARLRMVGLPPSATSET